MMLTLHSNRWPWGTTETVIIENGDAMVEMSFEDDNVGVCYISGLSVIPERRREGLAKQLMEYCETFCRNSGVFRLDLSSVKEQFVMDFYHKLGFCDIREENGYMKMYKIIKY